MFSYSEIGDLAVDVKECANVIRKYSMRIASEAIRIGEKLNYVKSILPHGTFGDWIEHEFGWTYRTAARYMQVAKQFAGSDSTRYSLAVMDILSKRGVPDEARNEVKVLFGSRATKAEAQSVVAKYVPKKTKSSLSNLPDAKDRLPRSLDEVFVPNAYVSAKSDLDEIHSHFKGMSSADQISFVKQFVELMDESSKLELASQCFTKQSAKSPKVKFSSPTLDEVEQFVSEELLSVDAKVFFEHYSAQGWVLGNGRKIVCWKATLRKWHRRESAKSKRVEASLF
jgi:hypothetical protein